MYMRVIGEFRVILKKRRRFERFRVKKKKLCLTEKLKCVYLYEEREGLRNLE